MPEVIRRKSCRAVLITPEKEVLLVKIGNSSSSWEGWITPGGGMDKGETELEALRRELWEELGLKDFSVAARIWTRFHAFPWRGKQIEQEEVYFWVPNVRFVPSSAANLDASEMLDVKEMRWWSYDEILSTREIFAPRNLAAGIRKILEEGTPSEAYDIGI